MSRGRINIILDSLFPICVAWILFLIFCIVSGAREPSSPDQWLNLVTFVLAQTLFLLASSLLLRRMMPRFDLLAFSLSMVFLSLFFLFGLEMSFQLWPTIRVNPQKVFTPSVLFRVSLAIWAAVATELLSNTEVVYRKEELNVDHS